MSTHTESVFEFNSEQLELRSALRAFTQKHFSSASIRELMGEPDCFDRVAWRVMTEQLGLTGLIVPELYGGSGASQVELSIALEELGAGLACVPFLATALATHVLLLCDDDGARTSLVNDIASGERIVSTAFGSAVGEPAGTARLGEEGWVIEHAAGIAIDGLIADVLLVFAEAVDGPGVFAVEATAAGVSRTPLSSLDLTRRQAAVNLDNVAAQRIGSAVAHRQLSDDLPRFVATCLAAEALGIAQRCLDDAVAFVGDRVQFGRVIGSFQAVKHACADLHVDVELARSAAYYAAWEASVSTDAKHAYVARIWCSDVAVHTATESIQLHGGIGFTWEHDAHLYLRRAKALQLMLGGVRGDRDVLTDAVRAHPATEL